MESENIPVVSKIFIHPVKSLSGILLNKAIVSKNGLVHPDNKNVVDRKWMIVDENGSFMSQRKLPKMANIKQSIENDFIVLSAPNKNNIKFPIDFKGEQIKCRLWSTYLDCYSYGYNSEISLWLSDYLETKSLNLVSMGDDLELRKSADFNSFMILSEASLEDLNSRLKDKVNIVNFRPNFVVKNCSAYSEDFWNKISISDSCFYKTNHCIRCLMVTIDPLNGTKSHDQEPLKTLKELNKELYGLSPMFGMYFELESTSTQDQTVSIGDIIKLNN